MRVHNGILCAIDNRSGLTRPFSYLQHRQLLPEQRNSVHYFAFCYPYSYTQLQSQLDSLDLMFDSCKTMTPQNSTTDIYYYRELLCKSLDGLRVDLLTVTSCKGMVDKREERLQSLFPDTDCPRAHRFKGKKVGDATNKICNCKVTSRLTINLIK